MRDGGESRSRCLTHVGAFNEFAAPSVEFKLLQRGVKMVAAVAGPINGEAFTYFISSRSLEEIEKQAISRSLERNYWRKMVTCRELGISRIDTAHSEYRSSFVQNGEEKSTWDWWPSYRKVTVGVRA